MIQRILYILSLFPFLGFSQSFTLGDSAVLSISEGTTFFFGGNTTLNGKLSTTGSIVSYSDIDFVANTDVGNLKFTGTSDQQLMGDTLSVGDFETDKDGILSLNSDQVRVTGTLIPFRGVIRSGEGKMVHAGNVIAEGDGYVEGILYGFVQNQPTIFPMGVAGNPNYITMTTTSGDGLFRVVCWPDIDTLLIPDEDIIGVSGDVEWRISKLGGTDSLQMVFALNYTGISDLATFDLSKISADYYQPAMAWFDRSDTVYHSLLSQYGDVVSNNLDPDGFIESGESVWVTSVPLRLNMAIVPIAADPILYIPNVFAPAAVNEIDRVFRPFVAGTLVEEVNIIIYDALNQIVYQLNEPIDEVGESIADYGWDGIIQESGLEAPEGLYFYKIMVKADPETQFDFEEEKLFDKQLVGSVLLMR